jgi:hypothetical protein
LKAREWAESQENRDSRLTPQWDCDPEHFYLCLDGALRSEVDAAEFNIIEADVEDIASNLQYGSDRDEGPWSTRYKDKTAGIAYRWAQRLPVTPPLISHFRDKITIAGGMHRLHLARYHGAKRMPFLVRVSDLGALLSILKSATPRQSAA